MKEMHFQDAGSMSHVGDCRIVDFLVPEVDLFENQLEIELLIKFISNSLLTILAHV